MTRTVTAAIMLILGALVACGGGRPDGELLSDPVQITAQASADGVPLLPGGATNTIQILVEGTMTTMHGIESSTYSWNGADPIPLELNDAGAFSINLDLVAGEGTLVLEGTPLVAGESSTLDMSFILDQESPTLVAPDSTFAASIASEGEMDINKLATSFTLSGGTPVPVIDGVTFAKFSTTYGANQPNLPVWRFNVNDNLELGDARVEFRIFKDTEMLVDWTTAEPGTSSDFEVTINTALHERFGTDQGSFQIESRAYDGANNVSESGSQTWTQALLSPPIFLATGSEDIMGTPGNARDPRSYTAGQNFSQVTVLEGLIIGSVRVGNPNPIPVLVKLDPTSWEPLASYTYRRTTTKLGEPSVLPPQNSLCGSTNQYYPYSVQEDCMGTPAEWQQTTTVKRQLDSQALSFEVRTQGGDVAATSASFVIPANTEYHVMAILELPMGNTMPGIEDFDQIGVFLGYPNTNVTADKVARFTRCLAESSPGICSNWDLEQDFRHLMQHYESWEFSLRVESKVNLDDTDATEWRPADPDEHPGYSRFHFGSSPGLPDPTSLDDIGL